MNKKLLIALLVGSVTLNSLAFADDQLPCPTTPDELKQLNQKINGMPASTGRTDDTTYSAYYDFTDINGKEDTLQWWHLRVPKNVSIKDVTSIVKRDIPTLVLEGYEGNGDNRGHDSWVCHYTYTPAEGEPVGHGAVLIWIQK